MPNTKTKTSLTGTNVYRSKKISTLENWIVGKYDKKCLWVKTVPTIWDINTQEVTVATVLM